MKFLISQYLQNLCFLNFSFEGFGGGTATQQPPCLGCSFDSYCSVSVSSKDSKRVLHNCGMRMLPAHCIMKSVLHNSSPC
jgi:hypothetical protein